MCISVNEPSSVILRWTTWFQKVENNGAKVPKQDVAKSDCVINPQNYDFNQFLYGKFWCSQNAMNQSKLNVELGYMSPRGLTGRPEVILTK